VQALIVTRGAEGSEIHTKDGTIAIPVAKAEKVVDPTGCGDAHRAGILYGLMNKLDWETTGRIGSLMGAIKIEKQGTQNHTFTPEEFSRRFKQSFGREFALVA
jgi:adenosine kinase